MAMVTPGRLNATVAGAIIAAILTGIVSGLGWIVAKLDDQDTRIEKIVADNTRRILALEWGHDHTAHGEPNWPQLYSGPGRRHY